MSSAKTLNFLLYSISDPFNIKASFNKSWAALLTLFSTTQNNFKFHLMKLQYNGQFKQELSILQFVAVDH